ncbi:MAG: hypothetical protein ACKO8O_15605, partial [Betaproteobacteria bacterium]
MSQLPRRIVIAQAAALLVALVIVLPAEFVHWREVFGMPNSFGINVDTTLPLVLIVALPFFWWMQRPLWSPSGRRWQSLKFWWCLQPGETMAAGKVIDPRFSPWDIRQRLMRPKWAGVAIMLIAATSLGVSGEAISFRVGDREQFEFNDLPPAFHDEYSYLFQAQTFLDGRFSYPSHPAARLFDQMHVVNQGRFASRYFP